MDKHKVQFYLGPLKPFLDELPKGLRLKALRLYREPDLDQLHLAAAKAMLDTEVQGTKTVLIKAEWEFKVHEVAQEMRNFLREIGWYR